MKPLLFLLAACSLLCPAQEPSIETTVLHYRRSYRQPSLEGTARMTLTLAFTPPAGYVVREESSFRGTIKGTDAQGQSISCSASALSIENADKGSAKLELALAPHPKGEWLQLQGQAKLTLASDIKLLPRHTLSLTEPSEFSLNGIPFTAIPAATNTNKSNQENGRLITAEVTLSYPENVTIMHICRIWQDEEIADSPAHRQELTTRTEKAKDGKAKLHISLWDAHPQEIIEMVTCGTSRQTETPINLRLELGGTIPAPAKP